MIDPLERRNDLHGHQNAVVNLLMEQPVNVFTAAALGRLEHLQAALNVNPEIVNARFRSVRTDSQEQHTNDWATPLWFAVVNNRLDTARALLLKGAERRSPIPKGVVLSIMPSWLGSKTCLHY